VAQKTAPVTAPTGEEEEHDSDIPGANEGGTLDLAEHLNKLKAQMDGNTEPVAPTPPPVPTAAPIPPKPAAPSKPAVPVAPVKPDPYVCAADGKSFKRKGYLLNHVKKNFPAREKELMAPYEELTDDQAT
jgi:hypothetical protein